MRLHPMSGRGSFLETQDLRHVTFVVRDGIASIASLIAFGPTEWAQDDQGAEIRHRRVSFCRRQPFERPLEKGGYRPSVDVRGYGRQEAFIERDTSKMTRVYTGVPSGTGLATPGPGGSFLFCFGVLSFRKSLQSV